LFVLKERKNRTIIGLVYVQELNTQKNQAELAYAISKPFTGNGYITQSLKKLSSWAFDQGYRTLQIIVNKENTPSIRVAKNCGFVWKATLLKEYKPPNEPPIDMELYELDYEG